MTVNLSTRQAGMLRSVWDAGGRWHTERRIHLGVLESLARRGLVEVRRDHDTGGWHGSLTWAGWRWANGVWGEAK